MEGRRRLREPATGFDAPPSFGEADERRMHARAHQYWSGLRKGRAFPSVAELHPASLEDFGPTSILLDFSADSNAPRLKFVGTQLRRECGLTGFDLHVDDVPARSLISRLTDHFHEILVNRAPIGFEAEFVSLKGVQTLYRGILMPLSSNGCSIDYVFGVINWKEIADLDLTAAIVRELASVDTAALPVTRAHRQLAAARTAAHSYEQAEERSSTALYRALAAAYDLYAAGRAEPGGQDRLAIHSRTEPPLSVTVAQVIRMVFGDGPGKGRLADLTAALSVAARAGVEPGRFLAFIEAAGGLKTLVAAERLARNARTTRTSTSRKMEIRSKLRMAPGIGTVAIPNADDEFVLLIARREADGTVSVVESVPNATNLLDSALGRLGSTSCPGLSQAA